jgi:hypothetical protein
VEPLDAGTAGIGVLLGLTTLLGLALAAAVVASGLGDIFSVS